MATIVDCKVYSDNSFAVSNKVSVRIKSNGVTILHISLSVAELTSAIVILPCDCSSEQVVSMSRNIDLDEADISKTYLSLEMFRQLDTFIREDFGGRVEKLLAAINHSTVADCCSVVSSNPSVHVNLVHVM